MVVNIDEKRPIRIKVDEKRLLGSIVALAEVIRDLLERQALRRMRANRLTDEEIERLGNALIELKESLDHIKKENNIEKVVESVKGELNRTTDESIDKIANQMGSGEGVAM